MRVAKRVHADFRGICLRTCNAIMTHDVSTFYPLGFIIIYRLPVFIIQFFFFYSVYGDRSNFFLFVFVFFLSSFSCRYTRSFSTLLPSPLVAPRFSPAYKYVEVVFTKKINTTHQRVQRGLHAMFYVRARARVLRPLLVCSKFFFYYIIVVFL